MCNGTVLFLFAKRVQDPAGGSPEEVNLMDGREHDGHLADALENKTKKHYYCHSFID